MPVTANTPDEHTAVVVARLAVPRDAAWASFADTAVLARWFWPRRLEPQFQGSFTDGQVSGRSDAIGMGFTAAVTEVRPEESLRCDWRWDGDADVTTVTVDFATTADGTDVTVTHGGNATPIARDEHLAGWTDCLGRLVEFADGDTSG